MKGTCQQKFEYSARCFTWAFGLILAGVSVSQVGQILPEHTYTMLAILYCIFAVAALITWYFDIKRLKKDN